MTTVDVTLRVTGLDLDDHEVGEVLATRFADVLWELQDDLLLMTFAVPTSQYAADAVTKVRLMTGAFPELKVLGVHRDFVNASDIAGRVGVSREAVRKWAQRNDFPEHHDLVGSDCMKIWAWSEVLAWLANARGLHLEETCLTVEQATHLENCLMRNPDNTSVQWQVASRSHPSHSFVEAKTRAAVVVTTTGLGHSDESAGLITMFEASR